MVQFYNHMSFPLMLAYCPQPVVFFFTTPRANSPNVNPVRKSTTSFKFGCVNTANVFLAICLPATPS